MKMLSSTQWIISLLISFYNSPMILRGINMKKVFYLTFIMVISKMLGFVREKLLAYFFGITWVADAYTTSLGIVSIILGGILFSFYICYIPVYINIKINRGEESANCFTNSILCMLCIIVIILDLILSFFIPQIVKFSVPGYDLATRDLIIKYTNFFIWILLLIVIIQILTGFLDANQKIILSNISNLLISSVQIIGVIFGGLFNKEWLIYGVIASYVAQAMVLFIFSRRMGYKFRFNIKFDNDIKTLFTMFMPLFLVDIFSQVPSMFVQFFSSQSKEGGYSLINYSMQLRMLIYSLVSYPLISVIYPHISIYASKGQIHSIKKIINKCSNLIIIIMTPITVGFISLSEIFISFVYKGGLFTEHSVVKMCPVFIMYLVGIFPQLLLDLVMRLFCGLNRTKLSMIIGITNCTFIMLFNFVLFKKMSLSGLALGVSISFTISLILANILLKKKMGFSQFEELAVGVFIKSFIASAIMALVVYFISKIFPTNQKIFLAANLSVCAIVGGIVYILIMNLFKVRETKSLMNYAMIKIKILCSKYRIN